MQGGAPGTTIGPDGSPPGPVRSPNVRGPSQSSHGRGEPGLTDSRPLVLVGVYFERPAWNLPVDRRAQLEAEFPELRWAHAPQWFDEGYGEALTEAEIFFGWHLDEADFRRAGRLRWIQTPSTGVRRMLHPALVESDVLLTCARGVHAPFMAEHVMAWVLAHARRLHGLCSAQDEARWTQDDLVERHPPESLLGKTMLLVGYGATGRELARRAHAFGMRVLAVRRRPERGSEDADEAGGIADLDRFLPRADVVVDLLPGTDDTAGFFDRRRLNLLPPGAFFANVGRGTTVDEAALEDLLASGRIGGAGLDVFGTEPLPPESPFWELANVQVSPHVAGVAFPALWDRLIGLFSRNLRAWREGRPLESVVDKRLGY